MKGKTIEPGETLLGWIGTGVMGRSMAEHCLRAGFKMVVYNRTPEKTQSLIALGATAATTPKAVAKQADVVITMVGYPSDVRQVILGDEGVLAGLKPNSIVVDMTTSAPSLAVEIYQQAQALAIASIDAPVSGGDVGAKNAALSIMAGGDKTVFDALMPFWKVIAKTINHMGAAGSGQQTKVVNQIAIASGMVAMVEALLYASRVGLDIETVLQAISSGAAGSWSLSNYAPRIIKRDFAPGFYVDHFVKDLTIALEEAKRRSLVLPGLTLAHELYVALQAQGHGQCGTQALILALEQLNAATADVEPH